MAKSSENGNKEKAKRPAPGPRPLYVGYRVLDASGNEIPDAVVEVTHVTRKAEEILKHVSQTGDAWLRSEIK